MVEIGTLKTHSILASCFTDDQKAYSLAADRKVVKSPFLFLSPNLAGEISFGACPSTSIVDKVRKFGRMLTRVYCTQPELDIHC